MWPTGRRGQTDLATPDGLPDVVRGGPSDVVTILNGQPRCTIGAPLYIGHGLHSGVRAVDLERDGQPVLLCAGLDGALLDRRMG